MQVADFLALGSSFRSSAISVIHKSQHDPTKILRHAKSEREALHEFLRVPAKSSFKRLILRTAPWQAYAMTSTKSSEGLKDSECEKGQLAIRPPISYIPPTDLHGSTDAEVIKVKLPDGTTVSVKAFSSGNNEEYILHWAAIFRLFDQKGLKKEVSVLAKAVKDQMGLLKNVHKSVGPIASGKKGKALSESDSLEVEETEKMVHEAKK